MPEFSEIIQIFKYFCIFVIGLIVGRVTMAVQMVVMKPKNIAKQDIQKSNQPPNPSN